MTRPSQIGQIFGFRLRTSAQYCKEWVESGFLEIIDFSNKGKNINFLRNLNI